MCDVAIGIDPGRQTGFAVWQRRLGQFAELTSVDFWSAVERLSDYYHRFGSGLLVVVEDPGKNKPVFAERLEGSSVRASLRRAQNVGMNKEHARLLIEFCEMRGIAVRKVRPTRKKWNADAFRRMTGYDGRTSQHARDAGRLVFGL